MATERSGFLAVLSLALAVRVAWSLVVAVVPVSDCAAYDLLAQNLASGIGYAFEVGKPTAFWPVGTSAVFAGMYRLFGVNYVPIVVLNIIVNTLSVALVMLLARRWYGFRSGLYSGVILALWPGQIAFSTTLASELIFNFGWLLGLYIFSRRDWLIYARIPLVAVTLAATSLVRPLSIPMPLIFGWILLTGPEREPVWSWRTLRQILAEVVVTLSLMLVLLVPWAERNRRCFGEAVLVSTNGGSNLWMGNNPETRGTYMPLPNSVLHLNEAQRDRVLKDEAMAYIKSDPLAFLSRSIVKLVQTHDRETHGVTWNEKGLVQSFGPAVLKPLKVIHTVYWWMVLSLGLAGVVCVFRRAPRWSWIGDPSLVLWAYFAALHAIIVAGDRYHYPSVPLIAALAGFALANLTKHRRVRQSNPTDPEFGPARGSRIP